MWKSKVILIIRKRNQKRKKINFNCLEKKHVFMFLFQEK
jgi:hypothetical protein